MEWWPAAAGAIIVVVLVIAQRRGWVDFSNKARSSGSRGMVGVMDEVFAPTRHEAQQELEAQTRLPAPAPTPGDGPDADFRGTMRIELSGGSAPDTPDAPPGTSP